MFIIHSRSPSPIPEVIEKKINIKKRKAEYDLYEAEKNEK
jgi:hypothetical protein